MSAISDPSFSPRPALIFSERHICGLQGSVIVPTGCQKPPRVTLWLPRLTPPTPGLAHCGVLMWSWECQVHLGHSEGRGTTLTHLASGGGIKSETSFSRLYAKHVNSGTSIGLCPGPNVPLLGRKRSQHCILDSPGESGLISRGSKFCTGIESWSCYKRLTNACHLLSTVGGHSSPCFQGLTTLLGKTGESAESK